MPRIHLKRPFTGSSAAPGADGAAGEAIAFGAVGPADVASAWSPAASNGPTLTTLVTFKGADGSEPSGDLIADARGDLFGMTAVGGADNVGAVFEIAMTASGYRARPTTLVSFTGADGRYANGSLIADANGDLFGMTTAGGADDDGVVFEIVKTPHGYASTPTTLFSFTGADGQFPYGSLIIDSAGDLLGTTGRGGTVGDGTVFEIAKTPHGYVGAPTTLVNFTGADGQAPNADLIADARGDLFGTTGAGGADGDGTVFEIVKTPHGYAAGPTTLASFTDANGSLPLGSLVADAAGDLFGTTASGGAEGDGTVFEIVKTPHGYASAPTTLVSFTGADGKYLYGGLIIDAAGNLFGTTWGGGAHGDGTVFEIARTKHGYAATPTTLISFKGGNGDSLRGTLYADAAGVLFGTTTGGGPNFAGTVFEITNSGFVPPAVPPCPAVVGAFAQAMATIGGAAVATPVGGAVRNVGQSTLLIAPRGVSV